MLNKAKFKKVYLEKGYTFDFDVFFKFLKDEFSLYTSVYNDVNNNVEKILENYNKPIKLKYIYRPLEEFGIETDMGKYNK